MPKELYLYSGVSDYSSRDLISQMEENKENDVDIRMNTNGGDPLAAWGMVAKMRERTLAGKKTEISVDGKAYSAGSFMLPFATKVKALNVSSFVVHRAAYSAYYEANYMTAAEKADLISINKDLRTALESKIKPTTFAAITGITFDQVFDMSSRIDVRLNAKQAFDVGLVDEIISITDSGIAASMKFIFEENLTPAPAADAGEGNLTHTNLNKVMTLAELKEKFPALYAEAVKAGADAESERVKSWMVFNDVDPKAVADGVKSGKNIAPSEITELTRKSVSAEILGKLGAEQTPPITTPAADGSVGKAEDEKKLDAYFAKVDAELGIKL